MASRPADPSSFARHRHLSSPLPPPATTISHLLFLYRHRSSSATIISLSFSSRSGRSCRLPCGKDNQHRQVRLREAQAGVSTGGCMSAHGPFSDGAHPTSASALAPVHLAAVSKLPLPTVTSSCMSSLPSPPLAQEATAMPGAAPQP
ncbi:hypothetical protein C2845_PM14G08910 [Panicum miliaceum]|uniref:Uncharacterized protein n=1 Tax=Panicum miliaceum TaxID=4540 RepID=A0A3L6PRL8_PANMI|nr:hypothetical protein C2845_PM14G08910 [Panicum miliaceum]